MYRLRLRGETLDLAVIAGGEPRDLCGSDLVDLVTALVANGRLSRRGRFTPPLPAEGLVLARGGATVAVIRADVDLFQRAKAAVGAGLQALLGLAGLRGAQLRRVCVGGAFGRYLDVISAQAVGLLPGCPAERVELCGDTALAGCAKVLADRGARAVLPRLAGLVRVVNLARHPGFDELFIDNLHLEPLEEMADDPRMATSG